MTTSIRKIALEEHFGATEPDIVEQSETHFTPQEWPRHRAMLLDIHEERLALMDECGIEKSVLSLLSPASSPCTTHPGPSTGPAGSTTTRPPGSPSGRTGSPRSPPCRCRTPTRRPPSSVVRCRTSDWSVRS